MEVNIVNQTTFKITNINKQLFHQVINKVVEVLGIDKPYLFSVIFVDDKKIHEINKGYRNIDHSTDVISFALMDHLDDYENVEQEVELGDIFISVDTAIQQAQQYGHSFDRELTFLFLHGLLHLLGYDHLTKEEETVMFTLQDTIIDEIISK